MAPTKEDLKQRYSNMDTKELVELHQTDDLTEVASTALEDILRERGVSGEERQAISEVLEKESDERYEDPMASLAKRWFARTIDTLVVFFLLLLPALISSDPSNPDDMNTVDYLSMVPCLAYLLFQDGLPNGQSIGKRLMRIAVVNTGSGEACGMASSFIRNSLLGVLGIFDLLFLISRKRQRLGDMAACTVVINLNVPHPSES